YIGLAGIKLALNAFDHIVSLRETKFSFQRLDVIFIVFWVVLHGVVSNKSQHFMNVVFVILNSLHNNRLFAVFSHLSFPPSLLYNYRLYLENLQIFIFILYDN